MSLNKEANCKFSIISLASGTAYLMQYCVSLQDPASASNGGSTTPNAPTSGKKGKKSRGKDAATDSGNGDAGTAENSESVSSTRAVIFLLIIHFS